MIARPIVVVCALDNTQQYMSIQKSPKACNYKTMKLDIRSNLHKRVGQDTTSVQKILSSYSKTIVLKYTYYSIIL